MNTKYYYWLTNISNIGCVKAKKLLQAFQSPKNIYNASYKDYSRLGCLSQKDIENIIKSKDMTRINNEVKAIENQNIEIIHIESEKYPPLLKETSTPPYVLYKKGNMDINKPCISIVGSRKCSEYGYTMAYELSKELTKRGILVVSGLAKGIDTAAHKGALSAGSTVAVLGNGVNYNYPPNNLLLQKEISKVGCLLSEYIPDTKPNPGFFPARNRIISGLSRGVLIVEAAKRSGSLITADLALEQNREVFAVPGNAWSSMSKGSNKLIQMGSKLVMSAEDIIEEIEQYLPVKDLNSKEETISNNLNSLAQDEIMVYDNLSQEPLYIDDVRNTTGIKISDLQHIITSLEIKGFIKRLPGQRLVIMK